MRIRSRLALIVTVAFAQACCLTWGVLLFDAWLKKQIRGTVHEQVLEDNRQIAEQLAVLIDEMQIHDPRRNSQSWKRLQKVVRDIRLPNNGFVCITDASTGRLICHPKLDSPPKIAQAMLKPSQMGAKKEPLAREVTGAIVPFAGSVQVVAAATLPAIDARVLVHQMGQGIETVVDRVTAPVRPIGLAVSLGLLVVTTLAVAALVRQYESRLTEINEHLEELVERRTRALMKTRNAIIYGLAKLAESRDTDTGEHLERIHRYTTLLAETLRRKGVDLGGRAIEDLGLASSLHDIGKVGVPDAILLKPGRLDDDERSIMETHATIGGECLRSIGERLGDDDFLQLAKEIAYGHHERWDGDGYPFGVAGERIPLSARIVAVADVYDALRARRPYKEPMTHERAKGILLEGRGTHFDPVIVDAFLAVEDEFKRIGDYGEDSVQEPCEAARQSLETAAPALV